MNNLDNLWVITHQLNPLFFRMRLIKGMTQFLPGWCVDLEFARYFPSESAAVAVIEEWGLESIANASVICPTEE